MLLLLLLLMVMVMMVVMFFWDLHTCSTRPCVSPRPPVAGNTSLLDHKPCPPRCPSRRHQRFSFAINSGTWSISRALDLFRSAASTCEPRPAVHRRGRSRALAHPSGPSSEHDGFWSCGHRDLKVAWRASRTALLPLQVSAEQSADWMTAMPSPPPIWPIQIGPQGGGQYFDRRFLSTILDSGARPYMPGKRATNRVERGIVLLAALKAGTERAPNGRRTGAERACGSNKEQRCPFVLSRWVSPDLPMHKSVAWRTSMWTGPCWLRPSAEQLFF